MPKHHKPTPRPLPAHLLEPLEPRTLLSKTIYVDASTPGPTHNGTSWSTAYTDLQTALAAASSSNVDQIYVAGGTYKPTTDTSRTATFTLKSAVNVYGGYAGHNYPAAPDTRDTSLYPTILSGDIGTPNDNSDNVYHVVTAININYTYGTTIDGFTITGGNANSVAGSNQYEGGGLFCMTSSYFGPGNCIFTNNSALAGGAIAVETCFALIGSCTFQNNRSLAGSYGGGAIYINKSTSTGSYINRCTFRANSSATNGGAIYLSSSTITDTIETCTFVGNTASSGGAIYNNKDILNVIYSDFASNSASINGNSLFNAANTNESITNCILWDTGTTPVFNTNSSAVITYSDLRITYTGTGNIKSDPLFRRSPSSGPDGLWGTSDDDFGDLHLQFTSPVIDAGTNSVQTYSTNIDLDGYTRPINIPTVPDTGSGTAPIVDIGAYEARGNSTYYVDASATGANNGLTWPNAFTDLQSALADVIPGDQIFVAAGTYTPTSSSDRNATFHLISEVSILGGYAGNATPANPDLRNSSLYASILSGDIGLIANNSDNSYHVVTGTGTTSTAVLDGFTITGGNGSSAGGGLYALNANPSVRNCIFIHNSADEGGAACISGSGVWINCAFINNTALLSTYGGGAVSLHAATSTAYFVNCSFVANSAPHGGAFLAYGAVVGPFGTSYEQLINCTFTANTATISGGGSAIYKSGGTNICTLTNCILYGDINGESSSYSATYSDIQGVSSTDGNINTDPKFIRTPSKGADNVWGTVDDDYGDLRLQSTSPAIDHGDSTATPPATAPHFPSITTDILGNPRRLDIPAITDGGIGSSPVTDMGAYETGLTPTAPTTTGPLYARLTSDKSTLQLFASSSPTGTPLTTYAINTLSSLTFNLSSSNDTITLDFSNGSFPPIIISAGAGNDTLLLTNLPAGSDLTILPNRILAGTTSITTTSVETVSLDAPANSTISLGSLGLSSPLSLPTSKNLSLRLTGLTITPTASLNLADNSLLLDYTGPSPLSTLRQYLHDNLLTSSALTPHHSLAYAEATDLGLTSFSSQPVDSTALLIKTALTGDANLDGHLDSDDFSLLDRGLAKHLSTWTAGDFNYDGQVTPADTTLLNSSFASITTPAPTTVTPIIAPAPPSPIIVPSTTPSPAAATSFLATKPTKIIAIKVALKKPAPKKPTPKPKPKIIHLPKLPAKTKPIQKHPLISHPKPRK